MERFIKKPNLPTNNVSLAIVDNRISKDIEENLNNLNIRLIKTEKISTYEAIAYHPDIMLHHLGENKIIVAPNISEKLVYKLEDEGFEIILGKKVVEDRYPFDIAYNVARFGEYAVCNMKYTDEYLLEELLKQNVKIIDVKQGYSKCSICIVNDKSIITSDIGIYKKLSKEGLVCLLISQGHIKLNGLNYGFIGGATGLISSRSLAFYGSLNFHPDNEKIKMFLSKFNVKWVDLCETPLLDYGTVIPLKEYCIMG